MRKWRRYYRIFFALISLLWRIKRLKSWCCLTRLWEGRRFTVWRRERSIFPCRTRIWFFSSRIIWEIAIRESIIARPRFLRDQSSQKDWRASPIPIRIFFWKEPWTWKVRESSRKRIWSLWKMFSVIPAFRLPFEWRCSAPFFLIIEGKRTAFSMKKICSSSIGFR